MAKQGRNLNKTTTLSKADIEREWYIIDAAKVPLGRLATQIATLLMGKHKANYADYLDNGDSVVVVNAGKVALSGRKKEFKEYLRYSGYQSGLKVTRFADLLEKDPEKVVQMAVKGMLPKNRQQKDRLLRLFVYRDEAHPHEAQQPKQLDIKE